MNPTRRACVATLLLLVVLGTSPSCASLTAGTYQDALARWRLGDHASAVQSARKMYETIRDDNGLTEAAVATAAKGALEALEETPILTTPPAAGRHVNGGGMPHNDPDALVMEVRADLLGGHVTAVLRATAVVWDFGLRSEVPTLLAVVYRRAPLAADGGVLVGASTALRSLAAKWAALGVLDRFARAPTVVPAVR